MPGLWAQVEVMNLTETIAKGAANIPDLFASGVVDRETAQRRASICLLCPLHGPGNALVGAAAKAIKLALEMKSRMALRVDGEKRLQTCGVCNCAMRIKIWQPREKILENTADDDFARLDRACWIRNE